MAKRVGVLFNAGLEPARVLAGEMEEFIPTLGAGVWLCPATDEDAARSLLPGTDLLLSLGGDGTILRADVLLPAPVGEFPVPVYRTPYGEQSAPKEWTTFNNLVPRGYAIVIQDDRGRYASGGDCAP